MNCEQCTDCDNDSSSSMFVIMSQLLNIEYLHYLKNAESEIYF